MTYSSGVKSKFLLFLAVSLACAPVGRGVEPPLPGEEAPQHSETGDFKPLLQPGDELPPGSEAPPMPEAPAELPPELFPDGMPPGADGVDGLPPLEPPGSPGLPEPALPVPSGQETPLLPPPSVEGMELAARAYWHKSPREARKLAKQERKPLLMFFYQRWTAAPGGTNGAPGGDNNISINDDLLASPEFNEFMGSRVVLTRLFYPKGDQKKKYTPEKLAALDHFRVYFKVKVLPSIVLLDENGREIARQRGYSRVRNGPGKAELSGAPPIFERLKTEVERREKVIAANDEKMAQLLAQDYREWTSRAGTKLLAKLVSDSTEEIILRDDAGTLRRVLPEQLSIVDQAWIHREQKKSQQAASSP